MEIPGILNKYIVLIVSPSPAVPPTLCRFPLVIGFRGALQQSEFWSGPGWFGTGEGRSDLYDKIKSNVAFRNEMTEKAGLGFELPFKILVIGRNGRKLESARDLEMTATA